jgi:hypothetical protein
MLNYFTKKQVSCFASSCYRFKVVVKNIYDPSVIAVKTVRSKVVGGDVLMHIRTVSFAEPTSPFVVSLENE